MEKRIRAFDTKGEFSDVGLKGFQNFADPSFRVIPNYESVFSMKGKQPKEMKKNFQGYKRSKNANFNFKSEPFNTNKAFGDGKREKTFTGSSARMGKEISQPYVITMSNFDGSKRDKSNGGFKIK
jgi:hypothetical protein